MGFDNPLAFVLMIGLPIFGWIFVIAWGHYRRFENSQRLEVFTHGSRIPSWYFRIGVAVLWLLAFAIIITGLAEPYVTVPSTEPKYKNVRIFFLLDVSGSMIYAEDVPPNRLAAVRKEVKSFYTNQSGYEVCLIPFAGSPNPYYCPLTYSKSVFLPMLDRCGPESAPTLGTDIPAAFDALNEVIKRDKLDESGVNVVVLMTDGGREEADATNRIKLGQVVSELANKNTKVYVVGIGGQEPAVLIRRTPSGGFIDYVKEDDGKIAYSQLDEEILKQIAGAGKGEYLHFEQTNSLDTFLSDVLKENRIADEGNIVYKKVTIQHWLFSSAAVLLWLAFLANRRRVSKWKATN